VNPRHKIPNSGHYTYHGKRTKTTAQQSTKSRGPLRQGGNKTGGGGRKVGKKERKSARFPIKNLCLPQGQLCCGNRVPGKNPRWSTRGGVVGGDTGKGKGPDTPNPLSRANNDVGLELKASEEQKKRRRKEKR